MKIKRNKLIRSNCPSDIRSRDKNMPSNTNPELDRPDVINRVVPALLEYGKTIDPAELIPASNQEAARLVATDPYAFLMAACLDRGTKAEIIWGIPFELKKLLGHLDPNRIAKLSLPDLSEVFYKLPFKPRFINAAPRTIKELTTIVVNECAADASLVWRNKTATQTKRVLKSIYGVGEGIASMTLLLIESVFGVRFKDREELDIKPDVHTMRVLFRIGLAETTSPEAAIAAARKVHPECPGELDAALWSIGRKWCFADNPNCVLCPVNNCCEKTAVF